MAIFVKYGSLKGEATATGYDNGWFEVVKLQWGVGRGISSGVGGGSKREATAPSVGEIVISKTMDAVSPLILKEAVGGDAKEVKIELTQTDGGGKHVAYQKYILYNTLVSGYNIEGETRGRPNETITLNFTKFDSEYIVVDDKFKQTTTGHVIYDIALARSS